MKKINIFPEFTPGQIKFNPIPKFLYNYNLKEELESNNIEPVGAIHILKVMLMNRYVEKLIVDMKMGKFVPYENFKFIGATHLSIGQEAVASGTMSAIRETDYITSTHRGHGHSIAKGAYRLYTLGRKELLQFLGNRQDFSNYGNEELLEKAMDLHLYKTICELLGKEDGYCRGRGGGMHIADFNAHHLGANAIVGGSYAIGVGAGLAQHLLGTDNIVVTIVGDGAANNGIAHEAMNFSVQSQFGNGLPVIFLVENNQYGMTGQQYNEVTGIQYLAQRGAGYNKQNMNAEVVNGMDVLAVRDAVKRAAEKCRQKKGPVLLECMTYRYLGHSLSDKRTSYRSSEEEKAWKEKDPINNFKNQIIKNDVLTSTGVDNLSQKLWQKICDITLKAVQSSDPNKEEIYDGLWSETSSDSLDQKWRTSELLKPIRRIKRMKGGKILFRHAIWEALAEEMARDKRVVLYGEDVADYGGAFGVTMNLLETFGRKRIFNAPISEAAIVGTACGSSMTGLRPVVEIMYIDFIPLALDQLGNQVAKVRYMFGGKSKVPLVLRTTVGGGKGYAGQHSQSLEAIIAHFPGLKVVAPFSPYDAKGLLKTAIRDDNPVVFIEHQLLYADLGKVPYPEEEYLIPFGKANILQKGKDVTLVSYLNLLKNTLKASELLKEKEGVEAEVIDLRSLVPLDTKTLYESVKKTGACAVIIQAPQNCSFAEHITSQIQRNVFHALKRPVEIISAYSVPPPMASSLEQENIPSPERIFQTVINLIKE